MAVLAEAMDSRGLKVVRGVVAVLVKERHGIIEEIGGGGRGTD